MSQLRLSLLGPLQAAVGGEPVTGVSSPKIQALLAYLAVERRPHPRGGLAELLWPERPARKAAQNLRQSLSRLRRALESPAAPEFIEATRQTLALNSEADVWVDVDAFTAAVAFTRHHEHEEVEGCRRCAGRLAEAVDLYRGDFLQELHAGSAPFEEWATLQREWLHGRALEALGHLAAFYLEQGAFRAALEHARRQVALEPWLERGHRQVMRALAAMGRRGEALAAYDVCRRTLAEALDVAPSEETTALYEAIRRETVAVAEMAGAEMAGAEIVGAEADAAGAPQPLTPSHNLPRQFTPFVGREQEQADVHERLDRETCALLTILGPGGVGKTRLAVEVAGRRRDRYRDGAWFVPLAGVSDPSLAPVTVANHLDLTLAGTDAPAEQLIDHLRSRQMLLLLDNVEHLCDELDWLLDLLRAAPDVQLLVTSRAALNFRAEWLYEVAGLPYPDSPGNAGAYAAPDLFVRLGQRLKPDFAPAGRWEAIVRICRLVEGMPLALELAAAQLPGAGPLQIAAGIAANLDHLATTMRDVPARQRSLRAVFTSSWELLTADERAALPRLSPFAGGFSADAARAVAGATPDLLERLTDKSFLRPAGNGRYQMHELLRHYAAEALGPEAGTVSARHAGYYADFAAAQHRLLNGDRQKEALATMGRDFDNLMAAWRRSLEEATAGKAPAEADGEPLFGRFTDPLWAYLDDRGLYRDGLDLFERALALAPEAPAAADARVWTYLRMAAGFFHQRLGQYPQARRHYERCLATYRRLEDLPQCAHCLYYLGSVAGNSGRLEDGLESLQEALAIYQRLESDRHVANTFTKMGSVLELMGRYEEAETILRQALALKREAGQPIGIAHSLNNLALLLWRTGHYDEAEAGFREALAINREIGNPGNEASCLSNLGRVLLTRGDVGPAAALLRESLALEQTVQNKRHTAIVLNNLGLASHLLGEGAEARAYLAQSLALADETGNRREAAYVRLTLARILLDDGDGEGAVGPLRRALQAALELRLMPLALAALVQAVRLLVARGETARAGELLHLPLRHPAAWRQTQDEAQALAAAAGLSPEAATAAAPDLEESLSDVLATL